MGIILVAVGFVFVGGKIVKFQTQGLFSSSQTQLASEISEVITNLGSTGDKNSITYNPNLQTYTLTVQENSVITVELPNEETSTAEVRSLKIENTRITNQDKICITRKGQNVTLKTGGCQNKTLASFCTGGRCVNNECQPDLGETCSNSGGDCECPGDAESDAASSYCKPDYKAGDHIEKPDAGDEMTDSTQTLGCVKQKFVNVQQQGEICSQDFECRKSLECSEPVESSSGPKRCCPAGKQWDPDAGTTGKCVEDQEYTVVYVPARYENGESDKFRNDAQTVHDYFVSKSPFKQCSTPSNHIEKKLVDINSCNIDKCNVKNRQCFSKVRQCANSQVGAGEWEKIVGVSEGEGPTITVDLDGDGNKEKAQICGKSNGIPADESITYTGCSLQTTASHEIGHSLGLFHVEECGATACSTSPPVRSCGAPNWKDTDQTSDSTQRTYLMSYCSSRRRFGDQGFSYLQNQVFDKYIKGCIS